MQTTCIIHAHQQIQNYEIIIKDQMNLKEICDNKTSSISEKESKCRHVLTVHTQFQNLTVHVYDQIL